MFLNLVQRTNAEQGYNTVKVWGDADIFRSLIFSVIALTSVRLYYTCHCGYFVTEPQNWGYKIGVSIQQPLNRLWGRQSRTHAREHENKELDYFLEHNLKTAHAKQCICNTETRCCRVVSKSHADSPSRSNTEVILHRKCNARRA